MSDPEEKIDPESENPFSGPDDEPEEEFSLDQLSQAYAKVLKEQGGGSDSTDTDEPSEEALTEGVSQESLDDSRDEVEDELLDDASCSVSPESILEAVLFVGSPQGEKLTAKKIAALMRDVSPKEIKALIKTLNARYESEGAAYRIVQEKTAYRMELAEEMAAVKEQFYGEIRVAKLSQPAVDVMAIVAYHQPVTREKVDKIRIRPSGSLLNQLVRRQLLEIQVSDSQPKQKLYVTTDRFLELFGLGGLEDLPQPHEVGSIEEIVE